MNSNISDKDKKDWDEFLLKSDHLPNKDNLEKKNKVKKTKSKKNVRTLWVRRKKKS